MWGLVFVGPLLLPDYPAALQSFGRYVAFGLIALPLAWVDRARLREFRRADWREAARLGLIGNIVYYLFLASAIQSAGGPLPTMIIGTLPVVIAIVSNRRDARRDHRLWPAVAAVSLLLIAAAVWQMWRTPSATAAASSTEAAPATPVAAPPPAAPEPTPPAASQPAAPEAAAAAPLTVPAAATPSSRAMSFNLERSMRLPLIDNCEFS